MDIKFQGTMAVLNDTHNPFQDQRVLREVELFLSELQPDLVVYPGDMGDFYLLSKFDKNPNRADSLQSDLNSTAQLFKRHRALLPNTRMIFELGNHEDRLRRFLWSGSPALASLDCLTVEGLYGLKDSGVECIDYAEGVLFNKNLMVTHGELIRAHSGYTAKGMSDKHGGSGIHGHSHRGGNSLKRNRFGVYGWWENFCLEGYTPILTADLRWRPLCNLKVGDEIVGFDEFPSPNKQRRLRNAIVTKLEKVSLPSYEITLTDGRKIVASENHLWLRGDNQGYWVKTKNLESGYKIRQIGGPWFTGDDWGAGYLSGVLDGEGFCDGFTNKRPSIRVGFAQNPNQLLDTSLSILDELGIDVIEQSNKRNSNIMVRASGTINALRLLGITRPPRLLSKLKLEGLGFPTNNGTAEIRTIRFLPMVDLISIETSTKTLFANGLASHNCLCSLDPDWITHPNWQQGFSVVTIIRERFWVEPIQINNRKFIYGGKL